MVQPGVGGLDTPRTNLGDATYLSKEPLDFDISQEQSFQSPSKDNNNIVQQLRNGRRGGAINLKTPRSRAALGDRKNLPAGLGAGEFTPLLKSATRNSAMRNGKENVPQTPALFKSQRLDKIPEDFSPLPVGSSVYGGDDSRNVSYAVGTSIPQIDSSSTASTPMALLPRRSEGPGVLQDGNQLSLREQENVIDRIEKENFGLKLKIHFLEEALHKAGPGYSEAALKENTELKVDKVTMQKELYRYKKTLTAAEHDLETYRQQLLDMQERMKRKHADQDQQEELERLREVVQVKEAEIERLRGYEEKIEALQDKIGDLEGDLREKDRVIDDREDEVENLKDEAGKHTSSVADLKETIKDQQRQMVELEEKAQADEELADANNTIEQLETHLERLTNEVKEAKEDLEEALKDKERAEADLEELQAEMANKSITTKGLSRQIEEKANRLQDDLEDLREKHATLEKGFNVKTREVNKLQDKLEDTARDSEVREQKTKDRLEIVQNEKDHAVREHTKLVSRIDSLQSEYRQQCDEKDLLQVRHDALTEESAGLQKDLAKARQSIEDLEDKLEHEKTLALDNEREVRDQYKSEIDRLNEENEDIRADLREKERLYDDDNDKWDVEKRGLESDRYLAEERATSLQRTIDRLQEAEGTLSSKEQKLQEALRIEKERHTEREAALGRQLEELNEDIESRQSLYDDARADLTNVREELRLSQRECKQLNEKIEGLEDEIEILQSSLDENQNANQDFNAAKRESESLQTQLQTLKKRLSDAENISAGAMAELQSVRSETDANRGSEGHLSSLLRETEEHLAKVRQDKQAFQDQLGSINVEIHTLRNSKAELKAERDEIQSQLRAMKQQEEETFRLDQERVDLRIAKMKLDNEVRRLREENKTALSQQQALEEELHREVERANAEETRLSNEIYDLQRIIKSSSSYEKGDLAIAKSTITRLENHVQELEHQISSQGNPDFTHELSLVRKDLSNARQKESECLRREAAQKDALRGLKHQISELERKAHDAEISRLAIQSPRSSANGSARKSEVMEVRAQLASAHQTLKEVRTQMKEVEREAKRRIAAVQVDLEAKVNLWESEKDQLEHDVDEARSAQDDLSAKNAASEATITRLRSKIERLETALQQERLNSNEDRTIALERRDLHEMLRETQIQAEALEVDVQKRESTIASLQAIEAELRSQLKRIREERSYHRSNASDAQSQLEQLEKDIRKMQEEWEQERRNLTRGVRFPNTSLSVNEDEIRALKAEGEERDKRHVKELRGMSMQIEWMKARCRRLEGMRADAAFAKKWLEVQCLVYDAWYVSISSHPS